MELEEIIVSFQKIRFSDNIKRRAVKYLCVCLNGTPRFFIYYICEARLPWSMLLPTLRGMDLLLAHWLIRALVGFEESTMSSSAFLWPVSPLRNLLRLYLFPVNPYLFRQTRMLNNDIANITATTAPPPKATYV